MIQEENKFLNLRFKVHQVPQGTELLIKFPELGANKEFSSYSDGDRNFIIRYIMYAYDPKSDLIELFPDNLSQRKEAALIEAGIQRNKKDEFDQKYQDIMELKNEKATDMIFAFLRILDNKTWMMIVSTEEMFLEYQRLIMRPISSTQGKESDDSFYKEKEKDILSAADIKKKLREECNSMYSDLKKYYKDLFGDNKDLEEANKKKKRLTPESVKFINH